MKKFLNTAIVLFTASVATSAFADDMRVVVSYADLNLAAPAGKAVLLQRLTNAAKQVCGSEPQGMMRFEEGRAYDRCVDTVLTRAMHGLPTDVAGRLDSPYVEVARTN